MDVYMGGSSIALEFVAWGCRYLDSEAGGVCSIGAFLHVICISEN